MTILIFLLPTAGVVVLSLGAVMVLDRLGSLERRLRDLEEHLAAGMVNTPAGQPTPDPFED